jgi:2-methylfumaryl-CoA isomerase
LFPGRIGRVPLFDGTARLAVRRQAPQQGGDILRGQPRPQAKCRAEEDPVTLPDDGSAPVNPPACPLAGLQVVELGSFVAVPSAGLALRQAGARVIRVDPVGGAPDVRRWPLGRDGRSLYWAGLNRGKESVELDLASAAGQAALRELVCAGGAGGGILLTNLAAKAWLADDLLRRDRPDLIYVQVTGRADGGPAVDYTVNAASGLAYATGPEDGTGPVNQALPAWDLLAGCHAAFAVLAAARHRAATGAGTFCRLPLEDVALSTLTTLGYLPEAQLTGTSRPPQGNQLYGTFGAAMPLADGSQVMIVALTGRQWRSLLEVTGTAAVVAALETALEADFSDEGQRYRHRKVLLAVMQPWFAARTPAEAAGALRGSHVLWSPFRHLAEVAADLTSAGEGGAVWPAEETGFGLNLVTEGPATRDGRRPPLTSAPRLGEHTESVLAGLAAARPAPQQSI